MPRSLPSLAAAALAFTLGTCLAVALVIASQPAAGNAGLPARVEIVVPPTGELATSPSAPEAVLRANLTPGTRSAAGLQLTNQTGMPLAVELRADVAPSELDEQLLVLIKSPDGALAETTLGTLRRGTEPLLLEPGQGRDLEVEVQLPAGATSFEGRLAAIELEPRIEVIR